MKAAEEGRYELVVSERLLEELRGVLMRRKFRRYLPGEVVPAYLARLRSLAKLAQEGTVYPLSDDPMDDYLISLAAEAADYLVSGDPHLLDLQERRASYISPLRSCRLETSWRT